MGTRNPSLCIRPDLLNPGSVKRSAGGDSLVGPRDNKWWTGKHPTQCPGFDPKENVLRSLPLPSTSKFTRQSVLDYFDNCWTLTEVLFASLQGQDAFIRQPYHQLRHPLAFYYAHPVVLYINKFRVAGLLEDGIDQYYEQFFETGVDEMSWDDLSQKQEDWPPVQEITEYRRKAYKVIRQLLETHPCLDKSEVGWDDQGWAVFMGFEHERIHLETSSVLIRELPLDLVAKPDYWPDYHPTAYQPSPSTPAEGVDFPNNDLIPVPGEHVVLGKPFSYPSFGWDNEYGSRYLSVPSFRASRYKITNGEFLRFVKAGGYSSPKYWGTEGWSWKTFRNIKWPTFWIPNGPQGLHKYKLRVLFGAIDMRWDWPVDANYHEAKAYCAWKTEQDRSPVRYRVVTEAEQMLLRNSSERADYYRLLDPSAAKQMSELQGGEKNRVLPFPPVASEASKNVDVAMLADGCDAATKYGFNFQLAFSSQNPVTELMPSEKGFHDVLGNAWEWGEDHFAAYPGFRWHPYYEDFSAPCFAGKHQMIIGGSFISTGQLASKYARYQFRPHFFQHASFRVVVPEVDMSQYDMTRYGPESPVVPFMETSCMDAAPPFVGDKPCCSIHRRSAFTPTKEEEAANTAAKNRCTQVLYESDELLAQVLAVHYGPSECVASALSGEGGLLQSSLNFHARCAEDAGAWCSHVYRPCGRALDLGCSVGRVAFELTKHFHEVVGLDLSSRVIEVANKIKENRKFDYDHKIEGDIMQRLPAAIDDSVDTGRVKFMTGDACALPESFMGSFDCVLSVNLMDRVPEPQRVLQQARDALAPGGLLLLTSPFSWSEEYTSRANWLGGVYKDGTPLRSADHMPSLLASYGFNVLFQEPMAPLLIPDHERKFQLLLTHKMILQRQD